MAIVVIPNQPVQIFFTDDFNTKNFECTQDNIDYCQQVETGDTTMFQMRQTPVTGDNLLTGQPFDSVFTGWFFPGGSWLSGGVFGAVTALDLNTILQGVNLNADTTYRIDYDVTTNNNMHLELLVSPTIGTVELSGVIATVPGLTGRFTAFARFSDTNAVIIGFESNRDGGPNPLIGVNNIDLLELTEPVVTTRDSDGNTVETITNLQYYEDFVQAQVDWISATYSTGIFNICVGGVDDLDFNFIDDALCLGLETAGAILQENGQCINWL